MLVLWLLLICVKGDWILVARLEQGTPSRRRKEGKLSPAVCPTCIGKLADTTINSLMGSGVVKLELIRQSTLECRLLPSVIFFDVGIGNFDSLAQRQATPFSLSESAALAGNFSTPSVDSRPFPNPQLENQTSFIESSEFSRPVCNFGADFGTFSAAYAWVLGGNCTHVNTCTELTMISVWIPSGSSPPVIVDEPNPTISPNPSGGVVATSVVLIPYQDFLMFGGVIVAALLVCCGLVCLLYHYRKFKRKAAKKRAKDEEKESALAVRLSTLQPAETTSRSHVMSEHSSLHVEGHVIGRLTGVPIIQDGVFVSYPVVSPGSPSLSTTSTSGRTPPYTKSTFPSAKTILPLTPIKLPATPRRSRTPPTPRSRSSDQQQAHTPFRFAFRSLNFKSPLQHHSRSNSSPEVFSRVTPEALFPTPVTRRGSISSPPTPSHVFCCGSSPYFVIRLLGKGHFGTAYLVTDNVSYYVLKTLHTPSSNARSKAEKNDALKEALSLASLPPSPHLLAFRDFFFEGSIFCIVVNYCSGGSLQDQIPFRLSPDEIFRILVEVSTGLASIHSKGFIHRDIKPDNLFFANAQERTVVIGDMGLARRVGADGYYTNSFGHTLYKAPEVQFGKWSKRSDMWAVGCVGLDLLSGTSMEERCKSNNMILGMKTDVELAEIIQEVVGDLVHPVVKVVRALLLVNPYRRLSADQVLEYKAAVQTDPAAEPPINPAQAPALKSPVCTPLPDTLDPTLELCSDGLLADVEHRSPSPLFQLPLPPSPPLKPISLPPSPVRSRKFSFCLPAKEPSTRRHSVDSCPSRSPGEEALEFSPLMTPVVFYSAE